jgi:kynurenine 3-monooxygenase
MSLPENRSITVVGGGLVGSLLATGLARRGFDVELLERRPDMRKARISAGRSINLAVSARGIHALRELGLADEVLARGVPMKGRMMHSATGELTYQPYGVEDWQCIYSISRGELNQQLLTAAERTGRVRIEFDSRLKSARVGADGVAMELDSGDGSSSRSLRRARVIGTDGSASVLRRATLDRADGRCTEDQLDYGYKEFTILPAPGGQFRMERNALHIWPRGNFMLIALPNFDGSFTCTLFLPHEGDLSLARLTSPAEVRRFFETHFADTLPLIEDLEGTFFGNPTGHMVTVRCSSWHAGAESLLLGDAAHAIVPFFGQGMNCGFEDCTEFFAALDSGLSWSELFAHMSRTRVENAHAIAQMAIENFLEMRDRVGDQQFLREKALEKRLQLRYPLDYISRYSLVSFSRVPYTVALEAGIRQADLLRAVCVAGADPALIDIEALGPRIRAEIAPVTRTHLPEGLKP